jgi:hypothetical protein
MTLFPFLARSGFSEEAHAGPLAELGEHVAGLDAEHVREVVSAQSRPGWLVMIRVTRSLLVSGPGLAGAGRLVTVPAGKRGGPVRGRGEDGDQHPGDRGRQFGPVLVTQVVAGMSSI